MENHFKGKRKGFIRLGYALLHSCAGFKEAYQHEDAFRKEVYLALVLLPIACLFQFTPIERILLIGSVLVVLVVELVNSAIEAAVDRISLDSHPLAKRAKDIASAAVLTSLVILAMVWGIVLYGRV